MPRRACIIGAGPNGLAAAIVLAQAGLQVDVYEAEPTIGGAVRSMELTLPGFVHDFGSAVHPLAVGSPFFSSLRLQDYGLEWIHPAAPVAHPLDDGTAVVLSRDLRETEEVLGHDGKAWIKLVRPFVDRWSEFAPEALRPASVFSRHPFLMGRFGLHMLSSARALAQSRFVGARARAVFAGLAAHSLLSLDAPLSAAIGVMFAVTVHAVGWPIPRGGAQSLTNALVAHFTKLGGTIHTSSRIESLTLLPDYDVTLCDISPKQLLQVAGDRLTPGYRRQLEHYRYGPGVFKVDFALSSPIPWMAKDCLRAATVHLGGSLEELAASEDAMANGRHSERPFVLLAQPTLFDPTRAPEGKHVAWAYTHVPNGSTKDMLPVIENQIERFAPGFRDCVLARRVFSPTDLEAMDANVIGGDIGGGAMDLKQFFFRPTSRHYATSARGLYLCSSSTPPGAGVHGMCGYHAAKMALKKLK